MSCIRPLRKCVSLSLFGLLFLAPGRSAEDAQKFLAHNLWYEKPESVSAIGYKRGTMIPAGTKVDDVALLDGRHSGVKFSIPEWDLDITVVIDRHQKDKLTAEALRDRMISDQPFKKMVKGYTEEEVQAVKKGVIVPGMRKEAALMSWGYPPLHRTPSTQMPGWTYWTSRFVTRSVKFDSEGKALNGVGN